MNPGYDHRTGSHQMSAATSDRRRHPRYRFSIPITVHAADETATSGMSLEISGSGISVLLGVSLKIGETVELEPIAGSKASALVRRKTGKVYGFEFINLSSEQISQIANSCKKRPLFRCDNLDI